jgi:hypothetical protein
MNNHITEAPLNNQPPLLTAGNPIVNAVKRFKNFIIRIAERVKNYILSIFSNITSNNNSDSATAIDKRIITDNTTTLASPTKSLRVEGAINAEITIAENIKQEPEKQEIEKQEVKAKINQIIASTTDKELENPIVKAVASDMLMQMHVSNVCAKDNTLSYQYKPWGYNITEPANYKNSIAECYDKFLTDNTTLTSYQKLAVLKIVSNKLKEERLKQAEYNFTINLIIKTEQYLTLESCYQEAFNADNIIPLYKLLTFDDSIIAQTNYQSITHILFNDVTKFDLLIQTSKALIVLLDTVKNGNKITFNLFDALAAIARACTTHRMQQPKIKNLAAFTDEQASKIKLPCANRHITINANRLKLGNEVCKELSDIQLNDDTKVANYIEDQRLALEYCRQRCKLQIDIDYSQINEDNLQDGEDPYSMEEFIFSSNHNPYSNLGFTEDKLKDLFSYVIYIEQNMNYEKFRFYVVTRCATTKKLKQELCEHAIKNYYSYLQQPRTQDEKIQIIFALVSFINKIYNYDAVGLTAILPLVLLYEQGLWQKDSYPTHPEKLVNILSSEKTSEKIKNLLSVAPKINDDKWQQLVALYEFD